MCYGTCEFEIYMGECGIIFSEKIEKELGFKPCFIGGNACFPEEIEYYNELKQKGEICRMKKIIQEKYCGNWKDGI
jgi:hypothetical protein